jgi:cell division protein FtsI (penicillin-binding protein 3)
MSKSVRYSASPLLAAPTPVWRSKLIVAGMALGFVVLAGRAAYIQVVGNDFYQKQGQVRFARTLELPASRGRIMDRNGLVLAYNVPAPSFWAIPEDVQASPAQLAELARLLEVPLADLKQRLSDEDKTFVWLKRQVDEPVAKQIAALGIKGIYQRAGYKRQYPDGEAAAHVVGFANVENIGQEGVELAFDKQLAGQAGSRRVIKDRLGRVVEDVGEQVPPVDGRDLQLSIDSKVQFFAYQKLRDAVLEHKAKAGSVVVLDVQSGEVLALANYPSYSPAKRVNLSGAQLRNRALTDTFEPGSTLKPFTAALALEQGKVRFDTQIQTAPGKMTIGSATISDAHAHGMLTVAQVIQKSSNIGSAKLALSMKPEEMWAMFDSLGFGAPLKLGFPGEAGGRLRPAKTWKPIEQATMAYGHGISVTLIQLARAYQAFARDGDLLPLSLSRVDVPPTTGKQVFSAQTAREVRAMLEMAVRPGGTAPKAQIPGYRVAGKTGTAHKLESGAYANRYVASFVGFAPVSDPRLIVAVMIDEPSNGKYYGGEVAAPVFAQVMAGSLRTLGIQPDAPLKPLLMTAAEPAREEM